MMIVDDTLHVFGFNYTKLDIEKSRSFGIVTKRQAPGEGGDGAVRGRLRAAALLAGARPPRRQPRDRRAHVLTAFIKKATKQLLIYDTKVSDRLMLRLLAERAKAGVEIRVFGKVGKGASGIDARKLPDLRLHVRAIIRDGTAAFIGQPEPAKAGARRPPRSRRHHQRRAVAKKMQAVFEADWAQTREASEAAEAAEKAKEKRARTRRRRLLPARDHAGVDDLARRARWR